MKVSKNYSLCNIALSSSIPCRLTALVLMIVFAPARFKNDSARLTSSSRSIFEMIPITGRGKIEENPGGYIFEVDVTSWTMPTISH